VCFARDERIGVAIAHDDELRAILADLLHLRGRRDARDENRRRDAHPVGGEGDGDAVVAAAGGDHPGRRDLAQAQIREGAARLEGASVLELFELEHEAAVAEPEILSVDLDDGGQAQVRCDDGVGPLDGGAIDGRRHADPLDRHLANWQISLHANRTSGQGARERTQAPDPRVAEAAA
jgi:hypothetical protein